MIFKAFVHHIFFMLLREYRGIPDDFRLKKERKGVILFKSNIENKQKSLFMED